MRERSDKSPSSTGCIIAMQSKLGGGSEEKMAFRARNHKVLIYDLMPQHFLL